MKKFLFLICFILISDGAIIAQLLEMQRDSGVIDEIYNDRIHVKGNSGSYIFEMISPCSWCEQGAVVFINFENYSRANMVPVPNFLQTSPIKLFIIKDGREENQ
jgi:hypothetical protein